MICSSREALARSASSIAFSVAGSSGSSLAVVIAMTTIDHIPQGIATSKHSLIHRAAGQPDAIGAGTSRAS
jgi:hypothetical protein